MPRRIIAERIVESFKAGYHNVHGIRPTVVLYSRVGNWYDLSCPENGQRIPEKANLEDLTRMTANFASIVAARKKVETKAA